FGDVMRGGFTAGLAMVTLAILAGPLPVVGSARAATHHAKQRPSLQAFLLSSAPDSLEDFKTHAGSVGVVYPTYFDCEVPSGKVIGKDIPATTAYIRERHIAVEPRFNCQDGATVHRILTDPTLRAATLARLIAIVRTRHYGGLCLDLENDGAADREALNSFVTSLARWLHHHGKKLAVVVSGVSSDNTKISTGFYDDRTLGAVADSVFVMGWGTHWAGSGPGPISLLSYVSAVARYVKSLPNASRFVLGAPMYGLDWAGEGGPENMATAYQYSGMRALVRSVGATPVRDPASGELTFTYTAADGVAHTVWYMDARTVLDILDIARANGLAGGLWRLGKEDQALWRAGPLRRGE
ncbi:MAG TPA: glycosyl hydrolase family 18 protein, partial [Solirubrobacteraceae bacterium]|nr:glycosyl hydrolase family 18 protein [Solirubrobacteraceae bacterium]